MPSRREFLHIGLAASMFPIAVPNGASSWAARRTDVVTSVRSLYRVVADVRFAESAAFGLEAERLGVPVVRITGDITEFWFNDLSVRWKDDAVAIAGMTAHGPLFCLERFGWDHGLRVVERAEVAVVAANEPLVSWVIAPRLENR